MAIDHKTITNAERHPPLNYPDTGSPGTNHVYQYNGSALEFGLVDTGSIASSAITTAKLDNGSVTNDKVENATLLSEKFQPASFNAAVAAALGIDVSPGSINVIPAGQPILETDEGTYQSYTYMLNNLDRSYSVIIFGIGSVTISFQLNSRFDGAEVNGRVLVNGSQVYAVNHYSEDNTTYSFTQAIKSGDVITFQCKEDGGQVSTVSMNTFEINADKYVPTFAGSVVS